MYWRWWLLKQLVKDLVYTILLDLIAWIKSWKEKPPFHPWNDRSDDD